MNSPADNVRIQEVIEDDEATSLRWLQRAGDSLKQAQIVMVKLDPVAAAGSSHALVPDDGGLLVTSRKEKDAVMARARSVGRSCVAGKVLTHLLVKGPVGPLAVLGAVAGNFATVAVASARRIADAADVIGMAFVVGSVKIFIDQGHVLLEIEVSVGILDLGIIIGVEIELGLQR